MSASQIVLLDLPTRPPTRCWSFNTWKTRLLLNFKGLNYTTEWTEYPDIKGKLQDHVTLPPRWTVYTVPAVILPDGTYMMNSKVIAEYFEKHHPEPSLHLDSPYIQKVQDIVYSLLDLGTGLWGVILPTLPPRILNQPSIDYWIQTRSMEFGGPSYPRLTEDDRGDKAWENSARLVQAATDMLKENEGPFFLGETVSYADFHWAGWLLFWKTIGDDVFEKLLGISGDRQLHLDLIKALEPWTQRDDH